MIPADAGSRDDRRLADLQRNRTRPSGYGLSLPGLALERLGERERRATVPRDIGQYVARDDEDRAADFKRPDQGDGWWYGSEPETYASHLERLARTDPRGELAPRPAKSLLNNRRHGTC